MPVGQTREFWVLMVHALVLGAFGAVAGLVFLGVTGAGDNWYDADDSGWFGGQWWWVAVTAGGGSISSPSGAVVVTNALGIASLSSWILGTTAGTNNNTVTATSGSLTGRPVSFSATGTAGAA